MTDKVFLVEGNKISAMVLDEHSIKFSSTVSDTADSFRKAFSKKLSLATKLEVKYDAIKSVKKEENDKDILIKYRAFAGIPSNCQFSFNNPADYEVFFDLLEKKYYFTKAYQRLTPFKAVINYLIGLLITIGGTIFSYYQAVRLANGAAEESTSSKIRIYNYLIGLLGDKGVIAVGILISGYLIYKIWTRLNNPPSQLILLPPNG